MNNECFDTFLEYYFKIINCKNTLFVSDINYIQKVFYFYLIMHLIIKNLIKPDNLKTILNAS